MSEDSARAESQARAARGPYARMARMTAVAHKLEIGEGTEPMAALRLLFWLRVVAIARLTLFRRNRLLGET